MTVSVLGPRGNSRPPYGSFAGKVPFTPADSKNFVQNFTVLGLGGYPKPLFGSFAGRGVFIPPPPVVDTGTVLTDRRAGGRHFSRKRWEELLEEIRLEEAALVAPSKAKSAVQAVRQVKRAAAELAERLERNEAEYLAHSLIAVERAAKANEAIRLANELMRDIQARLEDDEEDVLMLLLS